MSTAYALSLPAAGAVQVPPHERLALPNGVTLLIVPRRDVPLVAFQAVLRGGPLGDPMRDPVRGAGVASIVSGLLEKGAGERDAFAFADTVEGAGGNFSVTAGAEALSINGYWWYAANRDVAARIVRTHDEGIAEWVKANPTRFVGLTSPSLQHPDLAAEQLEYAVRTLGMRGASVGGNVRGEMISTEKYDPFWRKAEELQVPIFMHPTNADFLVNDNALKGRGDLGNIIGNPMETTLFLSSLIFDGTLDRFPRLKVCGAHGGGYLPSYFGRTQVTCDVRANARCANKKNPREYLRSQIMADTMVFTDEGLRHLVAEMGVSQIVYGTDIPFNWPDTLDLVVNASFLTDAQKEAIIGGNLINLLKIT